ncbi:MAG: gamma-glutamyl hydrolase [Paenibacillus sp.]|uniref:C40 family peptidase n=1 Tax=Paenibacillus sp. GCM10012303 TaxID=3317340 RepID=UPI0029F1B29E|nr:gamma-glutamyl hydrolase [Paenibacillus sp.]
MIRRKKLLPVRVAVVLVGLTAATAYLCNYVHASHHQEPAEPAIAVAQDRFRTESAEAGIIGMNQKQAALDTDRLRIVRTARKYLGTPYVYGAKYGQTDTFDCSSFAKTVFAEHGMELPRVSRDQAKLGEPVERDELSVGDLVFFATDETHGGIGHVGIYTGSGRMIHTYGDGGVKYSRIDSGYWEERYVTARRLLK